MARCEFLTEARAAARIDDKHHIAVGGVYMVWIAAFKCAARRRASAIVVHDHRIFARRVEVGRKDVASADAVATRRFVDPRLAFAEHHTVEPLGTEILDEILTQIFRVERIETVGIDSSLSDIHHVVASIRE